MNKKQVMSFIAAGAVTLGAFAPKANAESTKEAEPKKIVYTVQEGDTLGGISQLFFNTPKYYEELAEANNIENPSLIYAGDKIEVPDYLRPYLFEFYPREYAPDKYYVIQENDYMLDIVEKIYGKRTLSYVDKLATYNDLEDPNLIEVGFVLLIPEEAKLYHVEAKDYTLQYRRLDWRINHPGEEYPEKLQEVEEECECTLVLK